MTTTLSISAPYTKFSAQGYDIVQGGTAVPDGVVGAILQAARQANVTITSSASTGTSFVTSRRFNSSDVGAPSVGSWIAGDEIIDSAGAVFECTSGGTPGTWVQLTAGIPAPIFDVIVPAPTGGAATDLANLNAAVTACPVGGTISLRKATTATGPYVINNPWVISKALSVVGGGVRETLAGAAVNVPDGPVVAPFLVGTVIKQTAAAKDIIQVTVAGGRVDFKGIGLLFDDAIKFVNTGHGILAQSAVYQGGPGHDTGMIHSVWDDVTVFGHDGNHYAFRTVNDLICTYRHCRSHGGGVMEMENDSAVWNTGNATVVEPFGHMFCGGTAHGYHMKSRTFASAGMLNLNTFYRPQVDLVQAGNPEYSAATPPSSAQYLWKDEGPTGSPRDCYVVSPDFEGYQFNNPVLFSKNTFVLGGGLFGTNSPVAYKRNKPPESVPTVAVGGGAGTTVAGTASLQTMGTVDSAVYNDDRGGVVVTTGTNCNNGAAPVVTVTLQARKNIGVVILTPNAYQRSALAAFFVRGVTDHSFEVWAGNSVADNTQYQFQYHVTE